jgi:hypothetical protein
MVLLESSNTTRGTLRAALRVRHDPVVRHYDMQAEQELAPVALEALRIRMVEVLPAQIRSCLEQLNDEQVWWRPNERSNSAGNLVLHIRGAIMLFVCRRAGGLEYERNRDAEFSERLPIPKQQLLAIFNETIQKTSGTFDALDVRRLSEPSTSPEYYALLFEDLLGALFHFAAHTGQILYITKMLREASLDEAWINTHKSTGTWTSGPTA